MILRDLLAMSSGNLWRMKLRTGLTVTGMIIAVGAFVSMLSFGAGSRKNLAREYHELGLFSTILVTPVRSESDSMVVTLDDRAIEQLSTLPGVRLAFPLDVLDLEVVLGEKSALVEAQALPVSALETQRFSRMRAGEIFSSDTAHRVLVSTDLLERLGVDDPDSIVGLSLAIRRTVVSPESGLVRVIPRDLEEIRQRFEQIDPDSLSDPVYRSRILSREISETAAQFMDGFMTGSVVSDTLEVSGVINATGRRIRVKPLILPIATALRFSSAGISPDPAELFLALRDGRLIDQGVDSAVRLFDPEDGGDADNRPRRADLADLGDLGGRSYPRVTLDLDTRANVDVLSDSIRALGFEAFSYAQDFQQIRRFFVFFDLGLGLVGLIALVTASLGIANTLIMAVTERRKEIGILKSLGADDRDVRGLFLVEAAWIGSIGSILGIGLGWIVARIASMIAKSIMSGQGLDPVEFFATPAWLVGVAYLLGLGIALLAAALPARRASRVDPVEALRGD